MIPTDILEKIAARGTQAQKDAAKKTLVSSDAIRKRRELAPVPQEHAEGENRKIYSANNKTSLPGTLIRSETDDDDDDQAVNEAFDGSGNTYRLFLGEFSRKSLDGKGSTIVSTVHYDRDFDNAFFDGSQMVYGDGRFFNPFTRDLTVIGHELAHWLTSSTGNLNYQGQSGALNEHISDVFGALVEQYAYLQTADQAWWLIGGLLCEGKIQGRALRDMLNPGTAYDDPVIGKDPQPAHMDGLYTGFEDNGGVHINSGIPNRAFALAAREIGGFAWEKVGQVWYKVLVNTVKPGTKFQEFANMTYVEAEVLFGAGSKEQLAVQHGWDAVGIDATQAGTPVPDIPSSPCTTALLRILADPKVVAHVHALARNANVRNFLAQLEAGAEGITKKE